MSRAKDVLNAIRIGLQQGVIKSPDIEFLYSDGPKRVSMLQLVDEAIAEIGKQVEDAPMNIEAMELLGQIGDKCDNLLMAAKMSLPNDVHVTGMKYGLREIRGMVRAVVPSDQV